ncbi:hypothetical protein XENORESO_010405 [Xenotaenia resolanae]|uniref:Uncharacterized protein n=1 Tax=Xenotaenia resolanae TaxID=208358 RepID=A0ABV0W843_9TELE
MFQYVPVTINTLALRSFPVHTAKGGAERLFRVNVKMAVAKTEQSWKKPCFRATEDLRLGRKLIFPPDNHPKHTAMLGMESFRSKHIHVCGRESVSRLLNCSRKHRI